MKQLVIAAVIAASACVIAFGHGSSLSPVACSTSAEASIGDMTASTLATNVTDGVN